MWRKAIVSSMLCGAVFCLFLTTPGFAGVQYSNDFSNPSDPDPATAWPEWVDESTGGPVEAVNGRLEWTGNSNHWLRLDKKLPQEYVIEFDFFYQAGINGRFSFWPLVGTGISDVAARWQYFMRKNTHYYNGADTIPSEGPRDMTLPLTAATTPHRIRAEVKGDHVVLLYKDKGQGGFIKIDERDLQPFGTTDERYVQLGFNLDADPAGLIYVDNFIVSYSTATVFTYENNFDKPADADPATSWPEFIDESTGPVAAVNGRLEWTGNSNHWLRLDKALPKEYIVEFDFFYQADINGRFSFWPLVGPGISDVAARWHYFMRKNTHYYNGADTIPSEGPRDLTLPLTAATTPHRMRAEVSGDHVILLYKDKGQGGFIKIDERDLQPFGDAERYIQFGFNLDADPAGLIYVDNLLVKGVSANKVDAKRAFSVKTFEANTPFTVTLNLGVSGTFPLLSVLENYPEGWKISDISDGGVAANGAITWSLKNLTAAKALTYKATPTKLTRTRVAQFAGTYDSGDGAEPVGGETLISVVLPYFYREAVDYDYSPNPKNGKKYPLGHDYGVRYCQGIDGKLSYTPYERPDDGLTKPKIDATFTFPAGEDFYVLDPAGLRGAPYDWTDYRNIGEVGMEHGASDTNASIGGIDPSDWYRYTFDFGTGDQVVMVNVSLNTWRGTGDTYTDVYVDNKFKGEIISPRTGANEFNFFTVGPFTLTGGEHSIVIAFPSADVGNTPSDIGRLEVVTTKGIGEVSRKLTDNGMFVTGNAFKVTLNAKATMGSYKPMIEEDLPDGATATNISDGGVLENGTIFWDLAAITAAKAVTYDLTVKSGIDNIAFNGYANLGLPVAKLITGDATLKRDPNGTPVGMWDLY